MPKIHPEYEQFEQNYQKARPQIVWTRIINDIDTPVSAFLKLQKGRKFPFLLESVTGGEQRGRYSVLGFEPDLIFKVQADKAYISQNGEDFNPLKEKPMAALKSLLNASRIDIPETLPPMAAGLFGSFGYDMVRHIEHLPNQNPDCLSLPDAFLLRPKLVAIFDQIAQQVILCVSVYPDNNSAKQSYDLAREILGRAIADLRLQTHELYFPDLPKPEKIEPNGGMRAEEYADLVEKARNYIKSGDIFQLIISQHFYKEFTLPAFALYRALRRLNPSPFLYYFDFGNLQIVGSSPEILVRLRSGIITIRPIAGTRARGKTPDEDKALERELLADEKEMAEHLMLIDLARNDIAKVAKTGTIKLTEQAVIERYSHVMHIVSNIEGEKRDNVDALDCLMAGFPHGTVSGAPKIRAMEIIDELEDEKRGIYAGAIGYFSAGGDMDTAIALRTAIIKDGIMHVRAGGGLVLDSDAKSEWEECRNKAKALFVAARHAELAELAKPPKPAKPKSEK